MYEHKLSVAFFIGLIFFSYNIPPTNLPVQFFVLYLLSSPSWSFHSLLLHFSSFVVYFVSHDVLLLLFKLLCIPATKRLFFLCVFCHAIHLALAQRATYKQINLVSSRLIFPY